jgi:RNA polymerase sigma-70 factor (ECF subfamily)
MHAPTVAEREASIRAACTARDHATAVRLTLQLYGQELLQYLIARLRGYDDGWDAFGLFTDDLWRGIPGFSWRCSMRCWAYTLARNASNRHARARSLRQHRRVADLSAPAALAVAQAVRTDTKPYLRSALKSRVRALRDRLSPAEQELLTLRVDRQLSFSELARVLHEGAEPSAATLAREEVRLRKRYERVTRHLRALAESEGLLD